MKKLKQKIFWCYIKTFNFKEKFEILENENAKLYLSNQQLNLKNKPINCDREGLEITVKNLTYC